MAEVSNGKIPTTYMEKSRWLPVKNVGDYDIPPFAPCIFILADEDGPYRDATNMLVSPFYGWGQDGVEEAIIPTWMRDASVRIAFSGPSPIRSGGHGMVTVDFPAVCRVD